MFGRSLIGDGLTRASPISEPGGILATADSDSYSRPRRAVGGAGRSARLLGNSGAGALAGPARRRGTGGLGG